MLTTLLTYGQPLKPALIIHSAFICWAAIANTNNKLIHFSSTKIFVHSRAVCQGRASEQLLAKKDWQLANTWTAWNTLIHRGHEFQILAEEPQNSQHKRPCRHVKNINVVICKWVSKTVAPDYLAASMQPSRRAQLWNMFSDQRIVSTAAGKDETKTQLSLSLHC